MAHTYDLPGAENRGKIPHKELKIKNKVALSRVSILGGSAKLGYPLSQTITLHNGNTMQVVVQAAEITKEDLGKELFDAPAPTRPHHHRCSSIKAEAGKQSAPPR